MRFGLAVVLTCVAPLLAEDAKKQDVDYLSAWYTLEVEEQPQLARVAFDALLADDDLPAERRAMCTVGLARCAVALEDRQSAIEIYRKALRLADGHPKIEARVEKALKALGRGAHNGFCFLHYKQGFRFRTGKTVSTADADLRFASCAGGISSIEFHAPNGFVNLEDALGRRDTDLDATQIYRAVIGARPERLSLTTAATADSRTPESEVFILRTRDGGWVKFAVVARDDGETSWQKRTAKIVYTYHPDRPVFSKLIPQNPAEPVLFNRDMVPTDAELAARELRRRELIAAAKAGGGEVPDQRESQEVLLNRRKFRDYEKATYSFYFGLRDDPGKQKVRNDWELLYSVTGDGTDSFYVQMVSDDRSTITDLGASGWADLAKRDAIEESKLQEARAVHEHVYLVHTRDSDANSYTLFRVAAIRTGFACHIEWISLRTGALRTSPGLELTAEQKAGLNRLLTVASRGRRAFKPR